MDLSQCGCQEIKMAVGSGLIECGRPGYTVVFHQNDGKHVYIMCNQCADHNIKRRGGIELVTKETTT